MVRGLDQPIFNCPKRDPSTGGESQFVENAGDPVNDRSLAQHKFIGNLTVGFSRGDENGYLTLACGEPAKRALDLQKLSAVCGVHFRRKVAQNQENLLERLLLDNQQPRRVADISFAESA